MKVNYQIYLPYQFHRRAHSLDQDLQFSNKKMKTMFLSNMSKSWSLTLTFFPIIRPPPHSQTGGHGRNRENTLTLCFWLLTDQWTEQLTNTASSWVAGLQLKTPPLQEWISDRHPFTIMVKFSLSESFRWTIRWWRDIFILDRFRVCSKSNFYRQKGINRLGSDLQKSDRFAETASEAI